MSFPAPRSTRIRLQCAVTGALAFTLACSSDQTAITAPVGLPFAAKGGGGGPTVSSTSPPYGKQATTLDVRIFGSGFTQGAAATWKLHGIADPNKVRTNHTTFVSSSEVIANITIAESADIALWDVAIALAGGKNGIGTEMFEVTSAISLGTLGGNAEARAINNLGQASGYTGSSAFVWEPNAPDDATGQMWPLGPGNALDIDNDGVTAVGHSSPWAVYWTRGPGGWPTTATLLPGQGGEITFGRARAIATDETGTTIAAGELDFGSGRRMHKRAAVWRRSPGGSWASPILLPDFSATEDQKPEDVSRTGIVVGHSDYVNHGVVWEPDGAGGYSAPVLLPVLPGDRSTWPNAISPDGTTIVGQSYGQNTERAVVWRKVDGQWQVQALPGAATVTSRAQGVSDFGHVAGEVASKAVLWMIAAQPFTGPTQLGGLGKGSTGSKAWAVSGNGMRAAGSANNVAVMWRLQ